jgi:hypothetical protein
MQSELRRTIPDWWENQAASGPASGNKRRSIEDAPVAQVNSGRTGTNQKDRNAYPDGMTRPIKLL